MTKINQKAWGTSGNDGIDDTPGGQFAGTNDSADYIIKSNGVERARFENGVGMIGFHTNSPDAALHIVGVVTNKPTLIIDKFPASFQNIVEVNSSAGLSFAVDAGGNPHGQDPNFPFGSTTYGQFTTSNSNSTIYGYLASAFNGPGACVFGNGATGESSNANAFGQDCEVDAVNSNGFGQGIRVDDANCFAFGKGALSTAANQVIFGSSSSPYNDFFFGEGVESTTPQDITFNATRASGTDVAGEAFTINTGQSTGDQVGGDFIVQGSDAGASSSSLNTLDKLLHLTADKKVGYFGETPDFMDRQFVIPASNLTKGVSSPTDQKRGPVNAPVLNFNNVSNEVSVNFAMPTDWNRKSFEIVLDWMLSVVETNGDTLDIDFDYQLWKTESGGNGLLKTATSTTGQITATTANGLAIGDAYRMRIAIPFDDANNPTADVAGMTFKLNLTNTTGVSEADFSSVCIFYRSSY